ncbi:MAG: transglycosylase SLT domain-containing protein [Bdellovibrionales bacterium]|nr:transglycosylase SLT domain-containing protein [Bdellovibrionales bacterium]
MTAQNSSWMNRRLGLALFFVALSACSGARVRSQEGPNWSALKEQRSGVFEEITAQQKPEGASRFSGESRVGDQGEMVVLGVKLQNTTFDFPVTLNSRVEFWVDYFTGRGRKNFERYLERSEFFIPYIRPILKENGMPEDLVYLAMIESGFNNHARSHAKAVGPWQFISATGKRYGLMVNWWVDERRDTRKSTLAAVDYLRELYSMFGCWELAAASYNAGEAKIARAIRRYGTRDFWSLSRHGFLRQETRDYVPKIIAAAIVAKNRVQFGFAGPSIDKHDGQAVAGDGELVKLDTRSEPEERSSSDSDITARDSIAKILAEEAEQGGVEQVDGDVLEQSEPIIAAVSEVAEQARPVPTPHVNKSGEVSGEELVEFELQSPADLLKIARAAGLSYQTVKSLNPEILRWCTPPGVASYRIRLPVSVKDRFLVAYNTKGFTRKVEFLSYRVKRGETLGSVARRFGIKVEPMTDLNGVSPHATLRAGSKIYLPIPEDRSRSLASLEVRDPPERRRYRRQNRKTANKHYRVSQKTREVSRNFNEKGYRYVD